MKNYIMIFATMSILMLNACTGMQKIPDPAPKKLSDYKKFVKDNFEYVGENFTYKARSIHYDKKKPKKGIYGSASIKDVKELKEEGIETEMIPWIEDNEN